MRLHLLYCLPFVFVTLTGCGGDSDGGDGCGDWGCWTQAVLETSTEGGCISNVASNGTQWVAVGFVLAGGIERPAAWISSDGGAWTRHEFGGGSPSGARATAVAYDDGRWMVAGANATLDAAVVWDSIDLNAWQEHIVDDTGGNGPVANDIFYFGDSNQWVVVGRTGHEAVLYTSTDRVSWTSRILATDAGAVSIARAGTDWVVAGSAGATTEQGALWVSTDDLATFSSTKVVSANGGLGRVVSSGAINAEWVAVGYELDGSDTLPAAYHPAANDLATWTATRLPMEHIGWARPTALDFHNATWMAGHGGEVWTAAKASGPWTSSEVTGHERIKAIEHLDKHWRRAGCATLDGIEQPAIWTL